jgi:23S rRNA pseudouridine1911/1915/1917 synthase
MTQFVFPDDQSPTRLDQALARWTGLGLRQVRAMIDQGAVTVDGRVRPKGFLIAPGRQVEVTGPEPSVSCQVAVEICHRENGFAALVKPGGMHSARGLCEPSLESCLPGLGLEGWSLVNRLDVLTSGLVLAASDQEGEQCYKARQDNGQTRKYYLALARGLVGPMVVRNRIMDDKRRVVRVTSQDDAPLRWTAVWPVCVVRDDSLVLVGIRKGRRHQIRAHLAWAGHALCGDPLYGAGEGGEFCLHHFRVEMPDFEAQSGPPWPWITDEHLAAVRQVLALAAGQWPAIEGE